MKTEGSGTRDAIAPRMVTVFPQVLASHFISCIPTPDKREIRKIARAGWPGSLDGGLEHICSHPHPDGTTNCSQGGEIPEHQLPALHGVCDSSSPQVRQTLLASRLCLGTSSIHSAGTYSRRKSWCVTHQPFRARQQPVPSRLTTTPAGTTPPSGVAPAGGSHHMERATHNAGQEICQQFNLGR